MANKVQFGLKNVHYAIATETNGATTYGTVKKWLGAVNINLSAEGESTEFYADDGVYWSGESNTGYSGNFENALLTSDILEDVYGYVRDDNDVLVEKANAQVKYIALMFEIDGDDKPTRYCYPRVKLSRAGVASATKTNTTEPQTTSIDLRATPRIDADRIVKFSADAKTNSDAYDGFFDAVTIPTFTTT